MTDDRIGEIWRLPENYCKPLAFGRAIEAECRGVPDYVWMIGTKGFMALFATEEAANDWQQMNGTNTPASYIQPVSIPVISAAPKPDPDRKHETVPTMAEPALARYNAAMEGCTEHNPVERLRFFLSIALTGQDWLDVERFIDDLKATSQPEKAEPVAQWENARFVQRVLEGAQGITEQDKKDALRMVREFRSLVHASAAPQPDRLKSEPVAGPDFCDRPTRPALEAVFRDRPEYFEPDCECGAVASEHCPACEPVAQEPVAFYIYKETAPRLGIQNVVADSLPWVYDQDPSSGFSARLKVYLAPPDQSAEVERLKADWLKLYEEFAKANNANYARIAELERQRDVLAKLLCRYRNETPPGHQPHMIAHEVDAALASVKGNAEVTGVTTGENDAT